MSEVLFPLFSTIHNESRERQFSLLLRATWLLTTLAVCGLAPLAGLAEPLMTAWISHEAGQQTKLLLQLLALAGMLGCATNASNFFLLGTGRTRWGALLSMTTGATTVAVAALVLPRYGLRGAAVAAVLSMLAQQALLGFYMLPRIFGRSFSPGLFVVSFHTPVIIGLVEVFAITRISFFHGLSLLPLLGIYPVLSVACGLVIIASQWRPSRPSAHLGDVIALLEFLRRKMRFGRKPICVA
jgi:O-antigen/teichoic acid export membrane protein